MIKIHLKVGKNKIRLDKKNKNIWGFFNFLYIDSFL